MKLIVCISTFSIWVSVAYSTWSKTWINYIFTGSKSLQGGPTKVKPTYSFAGNI